MKAKSGKSFKGKVLFIGGGKICEAIISGIIKSGFVNKNDVVVSEPDSARRKYMEKNLEITTTGDNKEHLAKASVVVLAVKPNIVGIVLGNDGEAITKDQLVVSVAAGVPLEFLESHLQEGSRVARVMPNTPCLVGEVAAGISLGKCAGKKDEELVTAMFSAVGKCFVVDEKLIDAVTGLSGSGPAYVFMVIQAMADGAVKMGLPRDAATTLAAQTVYGAAKMVLESGMHPIQLKDSVITPGGTTIAGAHELEKGGLNATLINAVEAATLRSKELKKMFTV